MSMLHVLAAVCPIFLVILVGYICKLRFFREEATWAPLEKITFFFLIPSTIIHTLIQSSIDFGKIHLLIYALFVVFGLLMACLCLLYLMRYRKIQGLIPSYTSIFQTSTRWNAFMAMAIVAQLFGDDGIAIVAIVMLTMMPVINVANILVMTVLLEGKTVSPIALVRKILANPIIVSCIVGLTANYFDVVLWDPLVGALEISANASFAIVLIVLGASIKLSEIRSELREVSESILVKLFLVPALTLGTALFMGLDSFTTQILVVAACIPTASNGVILAKQMGGNASLYANAASLQILTSIVTIPIWVYVAGQYLPH